MCNDPQVEFTSDQLPLLISQLTRIGSAIDKEFTLVSDRMNWLVTSESFIFGAFAAAAGQWTDKHVMKQVLFAMMIMMPILGITMAGVVILAIDAAHKAAEKLKKQRDDKERFLPDHLQIHLVSSKDNEHRYGNYPPKYIPIVIIIIWLLLIVIVSLQIYWFWPLFLTGFLGLFCLITYLHSI